MKYSYEAILIHAQGFCCWLLTGLILEVPLIAIFKELQSYSQYKCVVGGNEGNPLSRKEGIFDF